MPCTVTPSSAAERGAQQRALVGRQRAHAAQVAGELARADQLRHRVLGGQRGMRVERALERRDALGQRRRGDDVADPQRGRDQPRERADEADGAAACRSRSAARRPRRRSGTRRRSRSRSRARRAPAPRPAARARRSGESSAPVGNWCEGVTWTTSGSSVDERVDVGAVLVDREREQPDAVDGRQPRDAAVARVLRRQPVAGGHRRAQQQRERVAGAGGDDDVAGRRTRRRA